MLQKQLDQTKEKIADLATQLKLLPPKREIFGGMMGYELSSPILSREISTVVMPKNEKIPTTDDLEDFEEVIPITILPQAEHVIDEAEVVRAFYNIATILNYVLVENLLATGKALAVGDLSPWGKNKDTYKTELANQLNEAFTILFHAKLENRPKFLPLVQEIQNIAVTIIVEIESLFDTINSFILIEKFKFPAIYKDSAKSLLTALQFIFEAATRYQTVNQLTNTLEAKLANDELSNDQKIQLIQQTQVDILLAFFGQQKNINGRDSIFVIEESKLNGIIKKTDFNNIGKTIAELLECFISSETTLANLNSLRRHSIVNTVANQFDFMFNRRCLVELPRSILTLQEKIIQLEQSKKEELEKISVTDESSVDDDVVSPDLEKEIVLNESQEIHELLVLSNFDQTELLIVQPEVESLPEKINLEDHQQEVDEVNTHTQEELLVVEPINSALNNEDATEKSKQENPELKEEELLVYSPIIVQTETEKLPEKTDLEKPQQNVNGSDADSQKKSGSVDNSSQTLRPAACPRDPWIPPDNTANKSRQRHVGGVANYQQTLVVNPEDALSNEEQTKTHVDTPPLTALDVITYISLFLIFTTVGVGIGFAIGGIGGAILGGVLGAMLSEAAIFYLEDERTAVISPVEDQPIKHNRNNLAGNSGLNEALKFNQGNIYSTGNQRQLDTANKSRQQHVGSGLLVNPQNT